MSASSSIVFDVGGTNMRAGIYYSNEDEVRNIMRVPSPNFTACPSKKLLIKRLIAAIKTITKELSFQHPKPFIKNIGIAFPGPISSSGIVLSAPTLWGDIIKNFPLKDILSREMKEYKICIINDMTASGWRYLGMYDNDFCIITISSGVGCKVFHDGKLLLTKDGLGGELGHHRISGKYEHIFCNCGSKGHIGAISSGRGIEKLAKHLSFEKKSLFRKSILNMVTEISTYDLIEAIHKNDEFANFVLKESITPIVDSMACLYSFIGTKTYIFIGGFAQAMGQHYLNCINDVLSSKKLFGDTKFNVVLGEEDDNSGLIGMGKYMKGNSLNEE